MHKLLRALLLGSVFFAAANANAQAHLEILTSVEKEEIVTGDDGSQETRLVSADTVLPGDEVVYTLRFSNVSDEPADNIVITNPLPTELSYVDGSASGPDGDVEFSVDGGASYAAPAELEVRSIDGVRPARPDDFTHIRWIVADALAPGQEAVARFRARLN